MKLIPPPQRLIEFGQNLTRAPSGCLEWTAELSHNGYGRFRFEVDGVVHRWQAHRLVYTVYKGIIPDGLVVMHACDNPRCCAVEHLSLGTAKDNMQDAKNKKRIGLGVRFSPEVCREMFEAHQSGETQVSIANRYNTSQAAVWHCIKKRYPKHRADGFYLV